MGASKKTPVYMLPAIARAREHFRLLRAEDAVRKRAADAAASARLHRMHARFVADGALRIAPFDDRFNTQGPR